MATARARGRALAVAALLALAALLAGTLRPDRAESPPVPAATVEGDRPAGAHPAAPPPSGGSVAPRAGAAPGEDSGPGSENPASADFFGPAPPPADRRPTRTLRGRILRADGEPLVRPAVWFLQVRGNHNWSRFPGRVGEDGTFSIEVPEDLVDDSLKFDAVAEGFLLDTYHLPGADLETRDVTIVLKPPIRVRGRFLDEEGRPVEGSRVFGHYCPYGSVGVRSGSDGRFEFAYPAERHAALHVRHRGAPGDILGFAASSVDLDLGDLVVRPGRAIRGRVLGAEGRPVAGAEVRIHSLTLFGQVAASGNADAEGRFAFEGLGRGPFEAFALLPGKEGGPPTGARAVGLEAGDAPVDLVVGPLIELEVRFLDADTGKPTEVVSSMVTLRRRGAPEGHCSARHYRDCRRQVTLYVTEPGEYTVSADAAFRTPGRTDGVEIGPGRENVAEVRLGHDRDR